MATTQESAPDYIAQRDAFKILKKDLLTKIGAHQTEIKGLEKQLAGARPSTPNGRAICEYCDTRRMAYLGRTPQGGLSGGDDVYRCEICHRYE